MSETTNTQDQAGIVTQVQRVKEFVGNSATWYRGTYITVPVSEVLEKVSGLMDVLLTGGDLEAFLDGVGLINFSTFDHAEDTADSEESTEDDADADSPTEV